MPTATITVLFTDMVGSTGLLAHGVEVADDLRRTHFASLRRSVETYGGTEVKTTGDGLMVVFTSSADAASAAVEMQQAIDRELRREARAPAVRVGLSAGEASAEDGDWFGPPVIEAARLCDAAADGQILTTSLIPMLVGDRGGHRFTLLGDRQLKGFERPVAVYELGWTRDVGGGVPLPSAIAAAPLVSLVGRGSEFEELQRVYKEAVFGDRRAALVSGEPGIGKSRLVAELCRRAHADGTIVLWGRCDEELAVAYQPLAEALGHLTTHLPSEIIANARLGEEIARLLPGAMPHASPPDLSADVDADAERLRLFESVGRLLTTASHHAPIVLVLDDIHWAARPTLLLARYLMRDTTPARVLVVGTYRDTDLDRGHPLEAVLADLRRVDSVTRVALTGLDAGGVESFIESAGGHSLDDRAEQLAGLVHAETEGNPFFVGQILQHLVESGAIHQNDGRWTSDRAIADLGIPDGIREVVGRRLSRLSESTNRALTVGAVLGRDFDFRDLREVPDAAEDADGLLDALQEAVGARVVEAVSGSTTKYTFAHALVRQTLLAELIPARRARLHRRVAEALAKRQGVNPALVAHHFAEGATPGDTNEAGLWALKAASEARASLAFEEAALRVERALDVMAGDDEADHDLAAQLWLSLSISAQHAGDPGRSEAAAASAAVEARLAGSAERLAEAARRSVDFVHAGTPTPASGALLEEALELLPATAVASRAQTMSALSSHRALHGEGWAADAMAREAVALAIESGDDITIAESLRVRCVVLWGTPDLAARKELGGQLESAMERVTDPERRRLNESFLLHDRAYGALQGGDRGRFDAALADLHQLGVETNSWGCLSVAGLWRGMLALCGGRFADAETHANEALGHGSRDPNIVSAWAAQIFTIRWAEGRLGEMMPLLAKTAADNPGLGVLRCGVAAGLAESGDLDGAREVFVDFQRDRFASLTRDMSYPGAVNSLSVTCSRLRAVDAAEDLHALLLPYRGQLVVLPMGASCAGAADHSLGRLDALLGRYDDAMERFRAAVALEESAGFTMRATDTRMSWARALLAAGREDDGDKARGLLNEAKSTADTLGMTAISAEAELLLASVTT